MAAAALGLVAGEAYAQSSVTLYGVADAGVEFVNHQKPGAGQVARAIRAQSSQAQPKCASAGPAARDGSATRPQTTMSPPASNASAMAFAP